MVVKQPLHLRRCTAPIISSNAAGKAGCCPQLATILHQLLMPLPSTPPWLLVINGCLRGAGMDLSQWCQDLQAHGPVWRGRHCTVPMFPVFGPGYSCRGRKATPLGLLGSKLDKALATLREIPPRPRGSNLLPEAGVLHQVIWGGLSTNLETDAGILRGPVLLPRAPRRDRTP